MQRFPRSFLGLLLLIWGFSFQNPVLAEGSRLSGPELKIQAVACGASHSLVLLNDGTVWGCGSNEYGQLGEPGANQRIPVKIPGLQDVTTIACGSGFSLALKKDGTVWGWGRNENGLLWRPGKIPVKIPRLKDVRLIACGENRAFAVKKDGTVWGWGSNRYGQLGDGSCRDRYLPIRIKGLRKIKAIACGSRHAAAVKRDGTLWVWGSNNSGQLGDGTRVNRLKPVKAPGLIKTAGVVCGSDHTVVLKEDGTLWSWGSNSYGQLGEGTKSGKLRPVQVMGLTEVIAVAGGANFNLALRKDGNLWGWGSDVFGELGDVKVLESVDECIPCGGKNNVYYYDKPKPVQVTEGTGVAMAACGQSFAMMLKADGTIWSWGLNTGGQLAEGSIIDRLVPVENFYGRIVGKMALPYQNLTADQARARMDQEKDLIVLDVRTPEEYSQKHLSRSRLIPVDQLAQEVESIIPDRNHPVLVYCKMGTRSARAADILTRLGYKNVSNLRGGIEGWPYETVSGQ